MLLDEAEEVTGKGTRLGDTEEDIGGGGGT